MWLDGKWNTRRGCFGGQCNFRVDARDKLNVQFRPSGFKILTQPRSLPPPTLR